MDANALISRINARATDNAAKAKSEMDMKRESLTELAEKVVAGLDKIREIGKVVMALYEKGIVVMRPWDVYGAAWKRAPFCSEGIDHRVGFHMDSFDLWGVEGGGCDGASCYVNINTGLFVIGGNSTVPLNPVAVGTRYWDNCNVRHHLTRMANGIDTYVKSVEDFVTENC